MSAPLVNASSKKQIERPGLEAGIDFRSKAEVEKRKEYLSLFVRSEAHQIKRNGYEG